MLAGVKVADVPTGDTVPGTLVPLTVAFREKDVVSIVAGSIVSLKLIATFLLIGTAVAVVAGEASLTVGDVTSSDAPVVKLQT